MNGIASRGKLNSENYTGHAVYDVIFTDFQSLRTCFMAANHATPPASASEYEFAVTMVRIYYAAGDAESYPPARTSIHSSDDFTDTITLCFESSQSKRAACYLTLTVHRSVKPASTLMGKRIVRIETALARIDLHVSSAAAQTYWLDTLARVSATGERLNIYACRS